MIESIDIDGNVKHSSFTLSEILPEQPLPIPKILVKISGDNQQGTLGTKLINPLVVEVRDLSNKPLSDVMVKFTVIFGEGRLNGRFSNKNIVTNVTKVWTIHSTDG